MELYVKKNISIFSLFFLVFNHDFAIYIDITHVAASNTEIRSHIEYLIQTYNILVLIFILKIDEKCSRTVSF